MPISKAIRLFVRQRARFVCEYCGVSEIGGGGELTIDHYRPLSKGGGDHTDNLIYCCVRCNLHKSDYWPDSPDGLPLWNPRLEFSSLHFKTINDGSLYPLTGIGLLTLQRLNLNRPQLVARRRHAIRIVEEEHLLERRRELAEIRLCEMRTARELSEEQNELLWELLDMTKKRLSDGAGDDDV